MLLIRCLKKSWRMASDFGGWPEGPNFVPDMVNVSTLLPKKVCHHPGVIASGIVIL